MAVALYTNNASTTLDGAINDTVTSIDVTDASVFPTLSGGDYCYLTITNAVNDIEVLKVTAISTNTLTVVRGQDGSTAQSWLSGDSIELRLTAVGIGEFLRTGADAAIANLTVNDGAAGAVTASGSADEVVVEGSGDAGISILTPDASIGYLVFGSPSDSVGAFLRWSHDTNQLDLATSKSDASIRFLSGSGTLSLTLRSDTTAEFADNILLPNNHAIYFKDTGGTERRCLLWGSDNNVYIDNPTGGEFRVFISSGTRLRVQTANVIVPFSLTVEDGVATLTRSNNGPLLINRTNSDGTLVFLRHDNIQEGTIGVSGNTVSYNSFLGSHWGQFEDHERPKLLKGTIVSTIEEMCSWSFDTWDEPVGETPDETEERREWYDGPLKDGDTYEDERGVVHTISKEDTDRLPRIKVSDTLKDKTVYGVVLSQDAEDGEPDYLIAAIGAGYIRMAKGEKPEIGDLIQSGGKGCGIIQDDDIIRSSTVGKVTSTTIADEYDDGSFLIPCTLHCG